MCFTRWVVYSLCLELKHPVYINRAIQSKAEQASKDTMYLSGLSPMGTLGVRAGSCLPPALPGFPGTLTSPFQSLLSQGCSNLWNHTEWSPTWHCIVLPIIISRAFMVSTLMFKSFIHFEFILAYGVSWWFSFIFLMYHSSSANTFVEEVIFTLFYTPALFVKY